MSKQVYDPFDRANGALGTTPAGLTPRGTQYATVAWELLSGAFTVTSNLAVSSSTAGSSVLAVVDMGKRSNGSCDMTVSCDLSHSYGNAVYTRVVDINNWIRARTSSNQTSSQYYVTEYQHETGSQRYYYRTYLNQKYVVPQTLQRQVQYPNGCTVGQWGAYSATGTLSSCTNVRPTTTGSVGPCGEYTSNYTWVDKSACNPVRTGYRIYEAHVQYRSVTQNYATKWVNDGYGLQSGESFTGSTQYVDGTGYWTSLSASNPSPGYDSGSRRQVDQGGTGYTSAPANSTDYTYVAEPANNYIQYSGSYYWTGSTTPNSSTDRYTGTSRQAGPYTSYGEDRYTYLEKCVAGTVTTLAAPIRYSNVANLSISAIADKLDLIVDNAVVSTVTDATHRLTGTKAGFGGGASYAAQVVSVNNFRATAHTTEFIRTAAGTWVPINRALRSGTTWLDFDTRKK